VLTERDESESLRLLAYYTQLAESPFEETALRNFLDSKLPDYMRPSCLVRVDALPLNASGKVDRKALPKPPSAGRSSAADRCKPSNLWELQLCEIFRDVLGCGPVDPTDDFFRLGGTSLAAVKVFARAESVFRHRLPLAALFRSPTVRELASEFRQSKKGSWSVLVPIQPQGTLPPVFWLHTLGGGGGGGLLRYREAALRLEDDRPSFGIEAPEKPFENFGSMASHYADVILDFRPRGPYCLAGFCFGGNVAYAVACELEKRGILVDALFLLESAPPQKSRGRLLRYAFTPTGMAVLARRALLYSRMPLSTHRNLPRKLLARLRRSRNGRRNVPTIPQEEANGIPVDQLDAPVRLSEYPPHLQRYVQTHWAALLRYSPRRYSGSAVVFRVEKPLGYPAMRPDFGWSDWIAGEIAIEKIHGDHHHFLEPPAVNHLAERMRARLAGIA
jgi:thioesterase domain-containing protein